MTAGEPNEEPIQRRLRRSLKSAADVRRSLLDRLQPRPTQTDPLHHEREGMRKARFAGVRAERATVRAEKRCEFHAIAGTNSTARWARIPREGGHGFHGIMGAL
ncbi:DUF6481 family protein [Phenylobacterium sp.]|uniref:DUF6481 family protein n=1 Tax=Phenylobacterium sp. TaxID=1871053 RepID=UPI0039C8EBE9